MEVIASFALLTALWQATLGSSLILTSASVNPFSTTDLSEHSLTFSTTDLSEQACTPTTIPTVNLEQLQMRALQAKTESNPISDPDLQCPQWNGLPWVPLREDDGSYIPYNTWSGFVVWCDIDLPFRPLVNPNLLDLKNMQGATGVSLVQYIRYYVVYNKDIKLFNCTRVTLTTDRVYYLK